MSGLNAAVCRLPLATKHFMCISKHFVSYEKGPLCKSVVDVDVIDDAIRRAVMSYWLLCNLKSIINHIDLAVDSFYSFKLL